MFKETCSVPSIHVLRTEVNALKWDKDRTLQKKMGKTQETLFSAKHCKRFAILIMTGTLEQT